MKLLITGSSGLLGTSLVRTALEAGHEVHSAHNTHPPSGGMACKVDLTDKSNLMRNVTAISPDIVIHAASITDVDFCEATPELAMQVNGTVTGVLAQICQEIGSHFVYVSTDYVFDGKRGQYVEEDEPNPINVYGRSKLLGEEETNLRNDNWCIVRTSVLYGWGRSYRTNFATWLIQELSAKHECRVVTDQHCSPTLSTDLAKMLTEVSETKFKGFLHLAGATRISRYDFAVQLAHRFGLNDKLIAPVRSANIEWKARRPLDSSLNVQKAVRTLKNRPTLIEHAIEQFAHEGLKT